MTGKLLQGSVIVDSSMTLAQALALKQEIDSPAEVLEKLTLIDVEYYSFDNKLHRGQVVIDQELADDVKGAFAVIKATRFPVSSVVPAQDMLYMTKIEKKAAMNNSIGFNYRRIAQKKEISNHSLGRAIDINPLINPFIGPTYRFPPNADYNPNALGAITEGSPLVNYFKSRGWEWGGDAWTDRKDYMHFAKPLA